MSFPNSGKDMFFRIKVRIWFISAKLLLNLFGSFQKKYKLTNINNLSSFVLHY